MESKTPAKRKRRSAKTSEPDQPQVAVVPKGPRRRRSGLAMPALVDPVGIPVDADGRVEFIVIQAVEGEALPRTNGNDEPVATRSQAPVNWVDVAILVLILIVIFVIGMLLTH